jgi:hypothetical protein
MRTVLRGAGILLMTCCGGPALALDYSWGDLNLTLKNRFSVGAAFRMEERDDDLIGKLNVPGQQDLCDANNCISFTGDPAPNQRLVDAKGAFFGHAADDGNLNYDQHDIVAGATKFSSDLAVGWKEWQFKARGIAFYDTVNRGRKDFHTNTQFQPAETSRPERVENDIGADVDLYDAYVVRNFTLGERNVAVSVGKQILRWGESNFIALNSLSEINPPDANRLYLPGSEINEVFQPVPLLLISGDLFKDISAEFFYQFGWRPVRPPAAGSFFSDIEAAGGREFAQIGLGMAPEDPNGEFRLAGLAQLLTSTSLRALVDDRSRRPEDGGQYGLRLNYFAENLNGGTELGFYAMNYHSRLPYLSVRATDDSCLRDSATFLLAAIDCQGFNPVSPPNPIGLEPLPIDTLGVLLDYPEDIRLYGISFNTNLGSWSLAGEYSYRPDLPVQVGITDVIFAGLQPAFPRQDLPIVGLPVPGTPVLPGARSAVPDFLSQYRGIDIAGGQYIPGFERLKVGQLDLTAIRTVSSSNPIGADQIIFLAEVGATHVIDMPDLDELPFEGGIYHRNTHPSPGADGTGSGGVPDTRRFNPTQQTGGFAEDFAWGYRLVALFEYNDVFTGVNFKPLLAFFHDVDGIAPSPMQNFIEGRRQFTLGTDVIFEGGWTGQVFYQGFTGRNHTLRDRDFLSFSLSYTF